MFIVGRANQIFQAANQNGQNTILSTCLLFSNWSWCINSFFLFAVFSLLFVAPPHSWSKFKIKIQSIFFFSPRNGQIYLPPLLKLKLVWILFSFCGLLPSLLKLKNPASELTIMGPELRISSGYRPVFALPPRLSWQTPPPTPTTTTTTRDIRNSQRISWNSRKSKGITGILERPNSRWNSH